jgi:hypothetical protein
LPPEWIRESSKRKEKRREERSSKRQEARGESARSHATTTTPQIETVPAGLVLSVAYGRRAEPQVSKRKAHKKKHSATNHSSINLMLLVLVYKNVVRVSFVVMQAYKRMRYIRVG